MDTDFTKAVLSIKEAAERIGTTPREVRRLVRAGALDGLRTGAGQSRTTRVTSASVRRLVCGA